MTGRSWWRRLTAPAERTTGLPTSGNGASSFHLWWAPDPPPLRSAHAVLEVRAAPRVARLYFWALQVTFADGGFSAPMIHVTKCRPSIAPGRSVAFRSPRRNRPR